jgi:predicted Zn-dependent protease
MSTHPRTLDRVQRASAVSANIRVPNPITGRKIFLGKIRGMVFGGTNEQGFVRGRDFIHPELKFRFRVPERFHMDNKPTHVLARGPDSAIIAFDRAKKPGRRTPYDYLVNVWAKDVRLDRVERVTINGLKAATASARLRTRRGFIDLRLVAIRTGTGRNGAIYRFTFVTKPKNTAALGDAFRRTTYSFRLIKASEAAKYKPLRIKLVRVRRGDTVASLARRMAVDRLAEAHFRVINGLGPNEKLRPGATVKLVTFDGR